MDLLEDPMLVMFWSQRLDCSGGHITVESLPDHLKRRGVHGGNACSL
jgi:hypothetical protein